MATRSEAEIQKGRYQIGSVLMEKDNRDQEVNIRKRLSDYSVYLSSSSPLPEGRVDPQHHEEVRAHRWGRHCCPGQQNGALAASRPSTAHQAMFLFCSRWTRVACTKGSVQPEQVIFLLIVCMFHRYLAGVSQAPAQQLLPHATFSTPAPCHTSSICRQTFSVQQDKQRSNADYVQD
jgi:hypothetical protein